MRASPRCLLTPLGGCVERTGPETPKCNLSVALFHRISPTAVSDIIDCPTGPDHFAIKGDAGRRVALGDQPLIGVNVLGAANDIFAAAD